MRLFSIEPSAFAARTAARDKVNFTLNAESMRRAAPTPQSTRVTDGIAVIDIRGVMLSAPDAIDEFFGGFTNTRDITRQVEAAAGDPGVKAIILRVDSPGGSVEGLSELGDAVASAARRKRVIGQVESLAASAAYYAIAGASEIVSERMALVGSIGTIVTVFDLSEAFKTAGLRTVVISTGKYKGTGTLGTPLTADEEKYLQGLVDAYFRDFQHVVMAGRALKGLGLAEWSQVSDGRVFPASEALKLGLIDRLGTFGATVRRLQSENATPGQRVQAIAQRQRLQVMAIDARRRTEDRACKQRAALQLAELRQ